MPGARILNGFANLKDMTISVESANRLDSMYIKISCTLILRGIIQSTKTLAIQNERQINHPIK